LAAAAKGSKLNNKIHFKAKLGNTGLKGCVFTLLRRYLPGGEPRLKRTALVPSRKKGEFEKFKRPSSRTLEKE
jgi:hypothetical protein